MHECRGCGQACYCDQDDTWFEDYDECECECEECDDETRWQPELFDRWKPRLRVQWSELNTPERWHAWLVLVCRHDTWLYEYWTDYDGCDGCQHFERGWCRLQELPASYNPILTPRLGMIGMACMGIGSTGTGLD